VIRVVSWQCSGVAWVPWRIGRALAGSKTINYRAVASHPDLESYGLEEIEWDADLLRAIGDAKIVHLHHAYVARDLIPMIRAERPNTRIVVTIHGEPDRTYGLREMSTLPDAFHIVEPDLRSILPGNVPCTFIPNHPSIEHPGSRDTEFRRPSLFFPYSHVAQHKDPDAALAVSTQLVKHGWMPNWAHVRQVNANIAERLRENDAAWVQMRGYLDLFAMECWTYGALPVVLRPRSIGAWSEALGFAPDLPFTNGAPASIVSTLLSGDWRATIERNREGMTRAWTVDRCRRAWERFYENVA